MKANNWDPLHERILDSIPVGIIVYDCAGNVTYVNKMAEAITGYNLQEIQLFQKINHVLDGDQEIFWKTLQSGQPFFGFEYYCPAKDGTEIPVVTSTTPLFDDANRQIGIVAALIAHSEMGRLRAVEEHASLILDHISDGVITLNREGVITGFNRAAEDITGLNREEVKNRKLQQVFPFEPAVLDKVLETLRIGREYKDIKAQLQDKQRRTRYILVTTRVLRNRTDNVMGVMLTFRDITMQELLEEQVRQSEKLAVIGELAAGTAHEIRNPLTSVKGFIQLLDRKYQEDAPEKEYFRIILSELNRVNDIIREFLLLSKPTDPNLRLIDINSVLEDIRTLMSSDALLRNIELNIRLSDVPVVCEVDVEQIKQVFINLIRNAFEAIGFNGKLSIGIRVMQDECEVHFTDNGPGIRKEVLARIFEPFFTTKEEGTGLGLTVSYRIIQNHGGTILVESEEGQGTTFRVRLPLAKTQ
ncbi:PAS domain-containing protein [Effusibacillus pohliae]|uniref:PAS domain-containing protein n=1 Tax=Effusibacillus pohliae TaxID=232270 RepID=UPI00038024E8|nr:PAS domain-containing protein [Effusibacillus pohliae]